MNQSTEGSKKRLAGIHAYRRHLVRVTKASVTSSKTVEFGFRGPLGIKIGTVLCAVEGESPDQFAFGSTGGNIDLMGIVDFAEVRPNCTEVTLMVHYQLRNKFFAWLDRRFNFVDAFVTSELRAIRGHFEGVAAPVPERHAAVPIFEAATA